MSESADVPAEKDDLKALPLVVLLNDTQFEFDAEGFTEFHLIRARIQTDQGLQALGAIPFQWSPWSDTLTFHRASVLRGGQTIDVMPKNGDFTVLRRELGLSQALLTGELTALLQPEGLQIGDLLDIAVSIRHADHLLKGRSGTLFQGWDASPVGRFKVIATWPSGLPLHWRESAGLPPFVRKVEGGVTAVSLQIDDAHPLVPPAHAPQRFQHGRLIEFSTFNSWSEVAEAIEPLFAKSVELEPNSPLVEQARLIAAASPDPKTRAAAALQLVQSQVRYLAHADAAGGLTPQSADETWRLRYGDCKAKTALLIALLHRLGIDAQPALASLVIGDGLDERLPSPSLFNHALVRVRLDGRDYWLDGTRQGDRNLDALGNPAYGWVLPMGPGGGKLVRVEAAPAPLPQLSDLIRYDGSKGVTEPVGTHLEAIFRADLAAVVHAQMANVPPDRTDAALKAYWAGRHTAFTPTHMTAAWDALKGEETFIADGTSKLDWSGNGLELEGVEMGGEPDIKRDPASQDLDAPYAVGFPSWVETDESVVLPPKVEIPPAAVKQIDLDTKVGGVAYHRVGSVSGNVFRVVASQRGLVPEITAAEARASVAPLKEMGEVGVYAPAGRWKQTAEDASALEKDPHTADDHIRRGNALTNGRKYREALVEFDAAIGLDPTSQLAWADRAVAHAWLSDPLALSDADKADSLGKPEVIAAHARGILALERGDRPGAHAAFLKALTLMAADDFALEQLVQIEFDDETFDLALEHVDQVAKIHPNAPTYAHAWRAKIDHAAHHDEAAKAEMAMEMETPATADEFLTRAQAYQAIGATDQAKADAAAATRLSPSAHTWTERASIDGGFNNPSAEADIAQALKLAPDDLDAALWKVNAASAREDYAAGLSLLDHLIPAHPEALGNLLVGRAEIEHKLGDAAETDASFTRARALTGETAAGPDTLCFSETQARWRPEAALTDCEAAIAANPTSGWVKLSKVINLARLSRSHGEIDAAIDDTAKSMHDSEGLNSLCYDLAVENVELGRALAFCDASLKLSPKSSAALDSRALVLMRMERNADALAGFDAALAITPNLAVSLYGRGLVEKRVGKTDAGDHDIAEAVKLKPRIASDFEAMGVTR